MRENESEQHGAALARIASRLSRKKHSFLALLTTLFAHANMARSAAPRFIEGISAARKRHQHSVAAGIMKA